MERRNVFKILSGFTGFGILNTSLVERINLFETTIDKDLRGRVNHSVCRWCYHGISLEDLCAAAKDIGIKSIELVGPEEWDTVEKYGLTSAMPWGAGLGIEKGFNDPTLHDDLVKSFEDIIPKAADRGYDKIICFAGNRNGLDDKVGVQNCAEGLKRLMPTAEKYGVTMCLELLNSKVNHPDYQADNSIFGIEVCKEVGSDRMKLLYDIYHMQIMEGDVIATIRKYSSFFAHYHTGGVPGRNEIDDTQELNYPAIIRAILETEYSGYIGQEFIPKREDKLQSLKQGIEICDV